MTHHTIKKTLIASMLLALSQWSAVASAQEKTFDFLGEVDDAAHAPGYRDLVENGCWQCHGFQGQGMAGPALAPKPLPYEAFSAYVRKPAGVMPAFSPKVLSDERLKRIHDYLSSIPESPDPDSIDLIPKQ